MQIMIQEGSKVKYDWGNGSVEWKVIETYDEEVTKTIEWNKVTRKWESWNKALYIETTDGDKVLKSENEVSKVD